MSDDFLLVGGIIAILGLVFAYRAWTSYQQSQRLTELAADEQTSGDTVEGPIEVSEPAEPQRPLPNDIDDSSDGAPALWLWRVRRERKNTGSRRGSNTTWETVESGIAAGNFAIREEWNRIDVDASSVTATARDETGTTMNENYSSRETFKAVDDPFDSDRFYVGEPDIDVPLGEPSLPQRFVDEYLPFDLNVTLSFGRKTATPDRYQATVVRERDELLVRGSLDRSVEPPTLNGTDTTPLVFVKGNPDQRATRYRKTALKQLALGFGFALLSVGVALAGIL